MVEDPPDLRRREVRIEPQARTPADLLLAARCGQGTAQVRGPPVLPADGRVYRGSGPAVPHDHGLALVRETEAGDIGPSEAGLAHARLDRLPSDRQDLAGVLLHPSWAGVRLAEGYRPLAQQHKRFAERQGLCPGRAVIDSDEDRHGPILRPRRSAPPGRLPTVAGAARRRARRTRNAALGCGLAYRSAGGRRAAPAAAAATRSKPDGAWPRAATPRLCASHRTGRRSSRLRGAHRGEQAGVLSPWRRVSDAAGRWRRRGRSPRTKRSPRRRGGRPHTPPRPRHTARPRRTRCP